MNIFYKILCYIAIVIFISTCRKPQDNTVSIQGIVTDVTTGKPIPDVVISTIPISETPKTDATGKYIIEDLELKNYTVQATKSGYETIVQEINAKIGSNTCNFILKTITPSLKVTPLSYTAPATEGITNLVITSNIDWIAISSEPSWLTCSASGSGNSNIAINYKANNLGKTRSCTITIQGKNIIIDSQIVSFTQDEAPPRLAISTTNPNISYLGGSINIKISSNIDWNLQSNQVWLGLPETKGNGDITIIANYNINNTTNIRSVIITASGTGVPDSKLTLAQEAAPTVLKIDTISKEVLSKQGSATIKVTSNISWTALSDQTWLRLTSANGNGDGIIIADYEENTSLNSRLANITISGKGAIDQIVTVTQLGKPYLSINQPTNSLKWLIGTLQTIQWVDNISENIKIELFKGGMFYQTIANSVQSNGLYNWQIPTSLKIADDYSIIISSLNQALSSTSQYFSITNSTANTVTDYDGNTYNTVLIGTQTWMKENLKATKYNEGSTIPNVTSNEDWVALSTPAYCWNNNVISNKMYGALYNWYVIDSITNNNKNVCPIGWHVPSKNEWDILIEYLGGDSVAGGKMKSTSGWDLPNEGATNESFFTALPSGMRDEGNGQFASIGVLSIWWSSYNWDYFAYIYYLINRSKVISYNGNPKKRGISIRCIKN